MCVLLLLIHYNNSVYMRFVEYIESFKVYIKCMDKKKNLFRKRLKIISIYVQMLSKDSI